MSALRRRSNKGSARAAVSSSSTTPLVDLPDYEPLSFSLSTAASGELGQLSNARGAATYQKQLASSITLLGNSVGDLQDRLKNQRDRLESRKRKRDEGGQPPTAEDDRLEVHLESYEEQVQAISVQSERALRDVIDQKYGLEDEGKVLGDLYAEAATKNISSTAQQQSESGDHAENEVTPTSIVTSLQTRQGDKLEEYNQMSMNQRYAQNNDYIGFKRLWHDAAVGEDGPPLADRSKWFNLSGEPVLAIQGALGGNAAEDDGSDDEIAVARENISLRCPLSLTVMKEPYSHKKCKHTFEKEAIMDYLKGSGGQNVECPQTGCSQVCLLLLAHYS